MQETTIILEIYLIKYFKLVFLNIYNCTYKTSFANPDTYNVIIPTVMHTTKDLKNKVVLSLKQCCIHCYVRMWSLVTYSNYFKIHYCRTTVRTIQLMSKFTKTLMFFYMPRHILQNLIPLKMFSSIQGIHKY